MVNGIRYALEKINTAAESKGAKFVRREGQHDHGAPATLTTEI